MDLEPQLEGNGGRDFDPDTGLAIELLRGRISGVGSQGLNVDPEQAQGDDAGAHVVVCKPCGSLVSDDDLLTLDRADTGGQVEAELAVDEQAQLPTSSLPLSRQVPGESSTVGCSRRQLGCWGRPGSMPGSCNIFTGARRW